MEEFTITSTLPDGVYHLLLCIY